MPRRCLLGLSICVLLSAILLPRPASAGNLLGWLKGHCPGRSPDYLGNPKSIFGSRPDPHLYPEYNVHYPWYGYGFGVPTYNWGYFGARYRPAVVCHKGYHGDLTQWGYRRGY